MGQVNIVYDIDKDWIPVILGILTPSILGMGWVFKTRREDRLAKDLERKQDKLKDLAKIEELQKQVFIMQQERISDEANKRKEADVSVKLMSEMTVLLKSALAVKEKE